MHEARLYWLLQCRGGVGWIAPSAPVCWAFPNRELATAVDDQLLVDANKIPGQHRRRIVNPLLPALAKCSYC